jgi:septum formation protein
MTKTDALIYAPDRIRVNSIHPGFVWTPMVEGYLTASGDPEAGREAVAALHPGAVVIGSDQVCDLGGQALGKPGDHANATRQLRRLSGQTAAFHTAVAVVQADTSFTESALATVRVRFRELSDQDIARYLQLDQPYDCAGSAKCETLGITLLDSIESDDPTALIGLPLIHTARLLRQAGIDPLSP